jgi:polyhydroxyalkanoate synthesis regulator phasin
MNEKLKKITVGGSAIALAIAMGMQTFLFGNSDIQVLKEEVAKLSERVAKLEAPTPHE